MLPAPTSATLRMAIRSSAQRPFCYPTVSNASSKQVDASLGARLPSSAAPSTGVALGAARAGAPATSLPDAVDRLDRVLCRRRAAAPRADVADRCAHRLGAGGRGQPRLRDAAPAP